MGAKKYVDFVPTISDSETDDIPDLEEDVETSEKKKDDSLNPDFVFDAGDDMAGGFEGWDFDANDDDKAERKSVDLDQIIKRKGGLAGKLAIEREESEDEEEEPEDEEEEAEDEEADMDEEELAMDGFGMGADDLEAEKAKDGDGNGDGDGDDNDNDEEEEEDEEDEDEEDIDVGDVSDDEEKEDSEEAINKFYNTQEGEEAKETLFKDFQSLNLSRPVLKGCSALGYTKPTKIQSASIPIALMGKDIVAGAQTGSGKTAAYMIPIIERLLYKPAKVASTRVVILAPTRELAIQVADVGKRIGQYVGGLTFGMAIGGLNLRQQEMELKKRPDIVIATPGRFIDHVRNSPSFNVDSVEIMVLDEADRMLEEGFQSELTEILELLPQKRQTMLFSATMNSHIKDLIQLSLKKPVRIMIDPPKTAASGLMQEFCRIRRKEALKPALLYDVLSQLNAGDQARTIVFVSTKAMAHRLRIIMGILGLRVAELHGALSQDQRLKSITDFKKLTVPILICTDLAARGLDIPKIETVINYDMPKSHEIYLHRVGRTARAGREGISISFVGEASKERKIVKEAINQVESTGLGKVAGRKVKWEEVEKINQVIDQKDDLIKEIMEEEKSERELLHAEMELRKGENLLKYKGEIESRPRRTWFQTEKEKKQEKVLAAMSKVKKTTTSKKRKQQEAREDTGRSYKKTRSDRMNEQSGKTKYDKIQQKKKKKMKNRAWKGIS